MNMRFAGTMLATAILTLVFAVPASAGLLDKIIRTTNTPGSNTPGQGTYTPPLHGSNPHGQGTVGVVDLSPDATRALDSAAHGEEVVIQRSRAERTEDGYTASSTALEALSLKLLGTEAAEGESEHGVLEPIQAIVLDPLCGAAGDGVCVEVLRQDSEADENGASSSSAVAEVQVGGENGIGATAVESNAEIGTDENGCEDARSDATTAGVRLGGGNAVEAASSSSDTNQCGPPEPEPGEGPDPERDSTVVELLGLDLPLPVAGCGESKTPDSELDALSPIASTSCHADDGSDVGGTQSPVAYAVREALSVFVGESAGTALVKISLGGSQASR
jgi:hypothetical protein